MKRTAGWPISRRGCSSIPESYQADVLLIASHLQRADYDQALKAPQSLEKKQPKNPLTYNLKGAVYLGKKDTRPRASTWSARSSCSPTYLPAATESRAARPAGQEPKDARRRLEAILEKDQNNVQALLALANWGPALGATAKEQIEWLERARGRVPARCSRS